MSSVCGIVDLEASTVDFEKLKNMGRRMILRGKEQSGAYIYRGVGLQHNRMILSGGAEQRQPYTLVADGKRYTVIFDGELYGLDTLAEGWGASHFECAAEAVLKSYITHGYRCVEYLDGAFAFAVYDESKREVFLARDSGGAKPLYYMSDSHRLVFASEIKGILAYMNESAEVDRYALAELVMGDMGESEGYKLYKGINELSPSSFAVHSRFGIQVTVYAKGGGVKESNAKGEILKLSKNFSCEGLGLSLQEVLAAFDYPVFDEYMPEYIKLIKSLNGIKKASVEDVWALSSPRYALDRADRLGMMNGIMLDVTAPAEYKTLRGYHLSKLERQLSDMAQRTLAREGNMVSRALGASVFESIQKEKDIKRRIRTLGKLIQCESWLRSYPIIAF